MDKQIGPAPVSGVHFRGLTAMVRAIIVVALLWLVQAAVAAPFACPPPPNPSNASCSLTSTGGTTTYVVKASALADGNHQCDPLCSWVALEMRQNGVPCNSNFGVHNSIDNATRVDGTCTVIVRPTDSPVSITVTAPNHNASARSITLAAESTAFEAVPACVLTAAPASILAGSSAVLTAGCTPAATSFAWTGGSCAGTSASSCAVTPATTTTYTVRGTNAGGTGIPASATVTVQAAAAVQVIEFYNTGLDNYFITANPAEAAAIDKGSAGPGWIRTGNVFASGGSTAVCRFYGSQSPGPNSHFYTIDAAECANLKQLQSTTPATKPRWNFESLDFFSTAPVNGACANGLVPVYRAYNNGFARGVDSNHRITTNLAALQQQTGCGWSNEGVVMCAPAGTMSGGTTTCGGPNPQGPNAASPLPDTGQYQCYSAGGSPIACAGTGQDGAYGNNLLSFQDNGNGTISDKITGLMWQKQDDGKRYTWFEATGTFDAGYNPSSKNVCGALTLGGQTGWRLPTIREWLRIIDFSTQDPGPMNDTRYFPVTNAYYFWSSTPYVAPSTYPGMWIVNLHLGSDDYQSKTLSEFVRCVHGASPPAPSLVDNANGTVTDNVSGLMWQQGEPGKMNWANALSYCEGLSLGGRSDWRLPNIKELESLTDRSRYNPAIDTARFPNMSLDSLDYWSSTTHSSIAGDAETIMFHNGTNNYASKSNFYDIRVRCVRNAP